MSSLGVVQVFPDRWVSKPQESYSPAHTFPGALRACMRACMCVCMH